MGYTLTKIKSFTGMDGLGLNATICCDGKPVAFVLDEGCGGELQIDFRNPGQSPASYRAAAGTWQDNEKAALVWAMDWYTNSPDAQESRNIDAQLAAQYPDSKRTKTPFDALVDWVNHTADEVLSAKKAQAQLNRWSKTKTVFRLKGDPKGEYRTLGVPLTDARVLPMLRQKYGDTIEYIHGASA